MFCSSPPHFMLAPIIPNETRNPKSKLHTKMKTHQNGSNSEPISNRVDAGRIFRELRPVPPLASTPQVCVGLVALGLFLHSILATHGGEITNRVSAIRVPGISKVVKAQRGFDGTTHLLFDSADGPQYAKSRDGGLTFSAPIPVVDAAARKPGLEFYGEDLAVGKEDRVLVAMSNNAWKLK